MVDEKKVKEVITNNSKMIKGVIQFVVIVLAFVVTYKTFSFIDYKLTVNHLSNEEKIRIDNYARGTLCRIFLDTYQDCFSAAIGSSNPKLAVQDILMAKNKSYLEEKLSTSTSHGIDPDLADKLMTRYITSVRNYCEMAYNDAVNNKKMRDIVELTNTCIKENKKWYTKVAFYDKKPYIETKIKEIFKKVFRKHESI